MSLVKRKQICKRNKKFNIVNKICAVTLYIISSNKNKYSTWNNPPHTTNQNGKKPSLQLPKVLYSGQ